MRSKPGISSATWALVALAVAAIVGLVWYAGAGRTSSATPSSGGHSTSAIRSPGSADSTPQSGLPTIAASTLPTQARSVLKLIHAGGPFRYAQDGQTFGNRERLLPARPNGYYKEYTVKIGGGDRGPNRIIGGRDGDLYWTADHYATFQQIQEGS